MGWRGAGGGGAANIGVFYFFGGLLQIIGAVLEWIIGNTYIYVVFGSFGKQPSHRVGRWWDTKSHQLTVCPLGAFWLAFSATLTPAFNAETAYTAGTTTAAEEAAAVQTFEATLGLSYFPLLATLLLMHLISANFGADDGSFSLLAFFLAMMGVLIFIYTVCAIRTNMVFFVVFVLLEIAVWLLVAAYWEASSGDAAAFVRLEKVRFTNYTNSTLQACRQTLNLLLGGWRLSFRSSHPRVVPARCPAAASH